MGRSRWREAGHPPLGRYGPRVGLLRKRSKRGDPFEGDALEAQIVERAVAVPVENSNPQTEAAILAGPIELFGIDAFQTMQQGEQTLAASYCWFGYGLRSAEWLLLDDARDQGASGWAAIGVVVADALLATDDGTDDIGPAIVDGAGRFCGENGKGVLFEGAPGLSADTRKRIMENWLKMEEGTDNAQLSRPDREALIVYGFAIAVVREYFRAAKEGDEATREGREPHR
jgi:hypothetical protein